MNFHSAQAASFGSFSHRNTWAAVKRGLQGHCPSCGRGGLFRRYLKVNDLCPSCGEELFHQRADDAPPYFTILVVGHLVVGGFLAVDDAIGAIPIWVHALIWPTLTVALSLLLLPRFKGALIGLQWATRMHGFGTAPSASRAALG